MTAVDVVAQCGDRKPIMHAFSIPSLYGLGNGLELVVAAPTPAKAALMGSSSSLSAPPMAGKLAALSVSKELVSANP